MTHRYLHNQKLVELEYTTFKETALAARCLTATPALTGLSTVSTSLLRPRSSSTGAGTLNTVLIPCNEEFPRCFMTQHSLKLIAILVSARCVLTQQLAKQSGAAGILVVLQVGPAAICSQ